MNDSSKLPAVPGGEFILYQTEDGRTKLEVRFVNETVWLSQKLMKDSVIRDFQITAAELSPPVRVLPRMHIRSFKGPKGQQRPQPEVHDVACVSSGEAQAA